MGAAACYHESERDLGWEPNEERESELQPLVPHLVVLVAGQAGPPREEPAPHVRLELEEGGEEASQLGHLLLAEEFAAEDLKVALQPQLRAPERAIPRRRRRVGREVGSRELGGESGGEVGRRRHHSAELVAG